MITFLALLKPVAKRNCAGEEWASHYSNHSCYTPVRTSLSQHSRNYPAVQALIDRVTDSPAGLELQENPGTASAQRGRSCCHTGLEPSARGRDVHGSGCQHWGFIPSNTHCWELSTSRKARAKISAVLVLLSLSHLHRADGQGRSKKPLTSWKSGTQIFCLSLVTLTHPHSLSDVI